MITAARCYWPNVNAAHNKEEDGSELRAKWCTEGLAKKKIIIIFFNFPFAVASQFRSAAALQKQLTVENTCDMLENFSLNTHLLTIKNKQKPKTNTLGEIHSCAL